MMSEKLKPEIVGGVPRCTEMCPLYSIWQKYGVKEYGNRGWSPRWVVVQPTMLARLAKLEAVARAARGVVECDDPNSIPLFEEILLDALDALKEEEA